MTFNTTENVAARLGLTPGRIRQLIKELNLQPTRIGKAIVLSESDVKKLQNRKTSFGPAKKITS